MKNSTTYLYFFFSEGWKFFQLLLLWPKEKAASSPRIFAGCCVSNVTSQYMHIYNFFFFKKRKDAVRACVWVELEKILDHYSLFRKCMRFVFKFSFLLLLSLPNGLDAKITEGKGRISHNKYIHGSTLHHANVNLRQLAL